MKTKQSFLQGVLLSSILLLILTLGIEGEFLSKTFSLENQQASLIKSSTKTVENIYNISPSKNVPGTFNFNYAFAKTSNSPSKEMYFDFPILPFDEVKARAILEKEYGYVDFGPIRDAWGYPVRENAFMKKEEVRKQSLNPFKVQKAEGYDPDTSNPGVYNCRANTSVTGYFKAHFKDVEEDTDIGFDDQIYGEGRRQEACQVLQDMSELLMMDTTTVTPDILFMRSDEPMPPNALAAASSNFGYYTTGPDNGALHKHIISRQDPDLEKEDAFIITNWSGVNWSVDSILNENTYDFYTVMWHEMMHALGFRALLPAVIQADVEHSHGTFDYHTHENETLQNRFITALTNLLNVPTGAPSPWFITNQAVYRGVKNILNAQPDGIRPIYSPGSWQQGSSLSHFDMGRANGEEYVMHPSISVNTDRDIHEHELEVLCHLGYQVEGLAGCEVPTPVAVDDFVELNGTDPVCVNFLENDISFNGNSSLSLNEVSITSSQGGGFINYFTSVGCLGGQVSSSSPGIKSIRYTPSVGFSFRVLTYKNVDSSGRISNPATIKMMPSCESLVDPGEYVCNGDFEAPQILPYNNMSYNQAFRCDEWNPFFVVPFWCNYKYTPDLLSVNHQAVPQSNETGENVAHMWTGMGESIETKLKTPLTPGQEYILSFDVAYTNNSGTSISAWLNTGYIMSPDLPEQLIAQVSPPSVFEWQNVEQTFIAQDAHEFLIIKSDQNINNVNFVVDNVSIIRTNSPIVDVPNPPIYSGLISGTVYQDLSQDGLMQTQIEPGFPGLLVNMYHQDIFNPAQTFTTQDFPNQGKYEFTNLPDGDYYITLEGEDIYPLITEPSSSNIFPGSLYDHARLVSIENGQMVENQNFGVALLGDPQPTGETDVSVRKGLHDDTLTLIDRQITWRIVVSNQGPQQATNVILEDIIPPGLGYVSHTTSDPTTTYNPLTGIYTIPTLNLTDQPVLDITMRVPLKLCGVRTNTVRLLSLDQIDINPDNDQHSSSINITSCLGVASSGKRF